MGHEAFGTIEAVGRAVPSTRLGELVVVEPNIICGRCESCRRGRTSACTQRQSVGMNRPGAIAELVVVPTQHAWRVPDGNARGPRLRRAHDGRRDGASTAPDADPRIGARHRRRSPGIADVPRTAAPRCRGRRRRISIRSGRRSRSGLGAVALDHRRIGPALRPHRGHGWNATCGRAGVRSSGGRCHDRRAEPGRSAIRAHGPVPGAPPDHPPGIVDVRPPAGLR